MPRTSPPAYELSEAEQRDLTELIRSGQPLPEKYRFILFADKPFRAFEVLNLGRYERQAYLNVGGRLSPAQREAALAAKEREFRDLILRAYKSETAVMQGFEHGQQAMPLDFEERWTGGYIFESEWQSFRTRNQRTLELITAEHRYEQPGRYLAAVKVIDIFGNDTMTLVPVNVG